MEVEQLKPYNLKIISFTEQGSRSKNEDRLYYSSLDQNGVLLLVADGMGGYEQGDLAAETAIAVISEHLLTDNSTNINEKIELAFLKAHTAINNKLINSGTTVGGIIIIENEIYVFWAGDVKIILNNGGINFASKEHNLINLLKEAEITIKPEEINRLTHTVVRSLGGKSNSYSPEIRRFQKAEHFSGIICTDGILQYYSNEDLSMTISKSNYIELNKEFNSLVFPNAIDNITGVIFINH
jgi:serine/threonine protein phosphatase PrpC